MSISPTKLRQLRTSNCQSIERWGSPSGSQKPIRGTDFSSNRTSTSTTIATLELSACLAAILNLSAKGKLQLQDKETGYYQARMLLSLQALLLPVSLPV
ncbi:hypothetical protein NKR19_g2850 [Coniochaeta hoffmannii]|uniref:Uncharacterized protein n=1 Tax=Coniochaeta hoffmannii TaxID=91930 RepID=A0AA38VYS4_9PEZI|nr:hypothetical protein NKR19_g2850 [Coniochaeta hoffmannii]